VTLLAPRPFHRLVELGLIFYNGTFKHGD